MFKYELSLLILSKLFLWSTLAEEGVKQYQSLSYNYKDQLLAFTNCDLLR